ncbi:MAG: uridine kinase [Lachnospiraceae bacterium]|nr:uridine kinase [Lachnospiraceae bacterium]
MKPLVIGICGGSGSGKTTVAQRLMDAFPNEAVLLSMDFYYKRHDELTYEERCRINYDHPESLDIPLMTEHLRALKAGEDVTVPQYDFAVHNRADDVLVLKSRPLIIVEGILLFTDDELANLMDIRVYVDTDADVRVLRRAKRDIRDRGRTMESVMEQYLSTVKPMHERFVEPSKKKAHIIVPEGGKNHVAMEMLVSTVYRRLRKMGVI